MLAGITMMATPASAWKSCGGSSHQASANWGHLPGNYGYQLQYWSKIYYPTYGTSSYGSVGCSL